MKTHDWKILRAMCVSIGLQVFAKWRPSTDIKAELAELADEAAAIQAVGETQENGLDDTQQARWDELMADEGLVAKKQAELDSVESVEAQKKELALARRRSSIDALADIDTNQNAQQPEVINRVGSLKAFKGENAAQDAHDAGMWFRAMMARAKGSTDEKAEEVVARRGWNNFQNTATEGTDTAGGHTVPDPVTAAFVEFRDSVGVARQVCDVQAMTAETLKVPKLTAGPTVQYPGEATATTATDQTWASVALTAVERSILSKVSNPLQADSLINFVDNVISRFGYEFALQEDNEFINGDGSGTFGGETGVLDALGAAGTASAVANWGAIAMSDITGLMGLLPTKHGGNPSFICSGNFYYSVMLKLLAEAGGNTIASIESGEGGVSFLGKRVYLTDQMPTSTGASTALLYGTFSDGVMLGDRSALEVMTSEHRYFEERVLGVIGVSRYDINVHEPGDGSDAGAYVGLPTSA